MNRTQGNLALTAIFVSVAVTVAACGGGSSSGGTITTPGKDTYKPPVTGMPGAGKPAHATDATCNDPGDCSNWYCACSDGVIVNSSNCTNGYCLDQTVACPDACSLLKHGTWTGTFGGGPNPQGSSSSSSGGETSSSGSGGGGPQCTTNSTPCGVCLAKNCCDLSNQCSQTSECDEYVQCTGNCAHDETCLDSCEQMYPAGAGVGRQFYDCGDAVCEAECG